MSALVIRPARLEDHARVAELFLELETGDPKPDATRFANELCPSTFVAVKDGAVVAYLFAQFMKDTVYIRHVATAPSARRTGAARALFAKVKAEARARGAERICLNVKPDNTAAIALYEDEGLAFRYTSQTHRFAWSKLPSHPVVGVTGALLDPAFDAELETRFGLPSEQIATTRAIPNKVIVGIFRDGKPVGLACFDPTFPGAFPIRAVDSEVFPALLDACKAHAIEDDMNVVIEDAPDLVAWLTNAGAPPRMTFSYYAGGL